MNKKIIKKFIDNQTHLDKIELTLQISESRSRLILESNEWYKDLYVDPDVDIVNSHPQVHQQVRKELVDFLNLLTNHGTKTILQVGLGHWGSTQFVLSLLLDQVTTVEYEKEFIERYLLELDESCEKIIQGDSTIVHDVIENDTYDALFIDGNHSYEYVKKDLENFWPKIKKGGIIALHDANFEGERYGTPRVLRESGLDWQFISHSKEVGIAYIIKE